MNPNPNPKVGRWLRLPSPAMTVACVALAVALSGASYAAVAVPRNSVGTAQLKRNAVTSVKVRNNSLTGNDINEARLGQVPSAATANTANAANTANSANTANTATNAANATNATNAANANLLDSLDSTAFLRAANVTVSRVDVPLPAGTAADAVAVCPAGARAAGGGVNPVGVTGSPSLIKSYPGTGGIGQAENGATPTSWGGWAYNPTGSAGTLFVFAICVS